MWSILFFSHFSSLKSHLKCLYLPSRNSVCLYIAKESFRSIARSYYRDAAGALLVFDVTRRDTFSHLSRWLQETRQFANANISITLVGNKCDLQHKRVVQKQEAMAFAAENGLNYVEASAKSAEGVDLAFNGLAISIWEKIHSGKLSIRKANGADGSLKVGSGGGGASSKSNRSCCWFLTTLSAGVYSPPLR